ncbi:MAG: hypothetical protein NTX63_00510 [Candidatus Peregrinibacteria bacterium]|nr:hypothetical protein [Candidatus Peregrinibacteria bacterium]
MSNISTTVCALFLAPGLLTGIPTGSINETLMPRSFINELEFNSAQSSTLQDYIKNKLVTETSTSSRIEIMSENTLTAEKDPSYYDFFTGKGLDEEDLIVDSPSYDLKYLN